MGTRRIELWPRGKFYFFLVRGLVPAAYSGLAAAAVYAMAGIAEYFLMGKPLEPWFFFLLACVAIAAFGLSLCSTVAASAIRRVTGRNIPVLFRLMWGGAIGFAACLLVDQPQSLPERWLPYMVAFSAGLVAAFTHLLSRRSYDATKERR